MTKGYFITVEGLDGAGKTTHLQWIVDYLVERGYPAMATREPGGTILGEKIREMLLHERMDAYTEALLVFAARRESVVQKILPFLEKGISVVSDRFTEASYAYQGGGRMLPLSFIDQLSSWVHPGLSPHLTLFFDLPIEQQKLRLTSFDDRFERETDPFFERVRASYKAQAKLKQYIKIVPAGATLETVRIYLKDVLDHFFEEQDVLVRG